MLIALILLIHFLGEIILPFIFALFLAYLIDPIIVKIQTKIPNRNVAITSFLTVAFVLIVGIFFFFGSYFIRDAKRLVGAVDVFVEQHENEINEVREKVSSFVDGVYESEVVQNEINSLDTMSTETKEKDITAALEKTYSLLSGNGEKVRAEKEGRDWNGFVMLIFTLTYLVTILYTYEYFQQKYDKYIKGRKPINSRLHRVWLNFTAVFLVYFRQRSKVVLISMAIFILAFTIMDLPGAIIIGILTGLLTYAAHFHYFSLPVVAIGCWVLSVETNVHFLVFFGILLAVYAIVSVLEETVFFNRIMKSVKGMNSAIVILAFSVWIYLLGGFVGTVLALPLTQFILIFVERMVQQQKEQLD